VATLEDLLIKIGVDPSGAEKGAGKIRSTFDRTWDRMKQSAAVAGVAIGAAVAAAAVKGLENSKLSGVLAAQLGATPDEVGEIGRAAGQLYAAGFGEDMPTVTDAIRAAAQNGLVDVSTIADQTSQATVQKLMTVGTVLNEEAGRVSAAVSQMLRTGMADSAEQAMDLLVTATQRGVNKSEDLLDTVNEYGTQFRKLGLDGPRALGLLSQAVQAGARDSDIAADALKELSIRAVDGSEDAAKSFKALGLNAKEMQKAFATGGPAASKALDQVLDRLRKTQGQTNAAQIAFGLFGTQSEDLGAALYAMDLSTAAAEMSGLAGATERAGDTIAETAGAKVERFRRQVEAGLIDALAKAVGWIERNQTAAKVLAGIISGALATVAITKFVAASIEAGKAAGKAVAAVGRWTAAVARWGATMVAQAARATASMAVTVARTVAGWVLMGAQALLNAARIALAWLISLGPIGLIIAAVLGVIAIFALLWNKCEGFRNFWKAVWNVIWSAIKWVWDWIKENWPLLLGIITGPVGMAVYLITKYWDKIKSGATAVWNWIKDKFNALVGFFKALPGRITAATRNLWNGLKTSFKSAVNWLIGKWNNFSLTLGGGSILGIDIPSITLHTPNIPYLAEGGIVPATPGGRLAVLGEGGQDEAVVPLPRGARAFAAAGGDRETVVVIQPDGSRASTLLVEMLRGATRRLGGDVQRAYGTSI